MEHAPCISQIATLLADPKRSAMMWALMDGSARHTEELALMAGLSPSSASAHLGRLLAGGLLKVEARGRKRFFRLTAPEVGAAIEAWPAPRWPAHRRISRTFSNAPPPWPNLSRPVRHCCARGFVTIIWAAPWLPICTSACWRRAGSSSSTSGSRSRSRARRSWRHAVSSFRRWPTATARLRVRVPTGAKDARTWAVPWVRRYCNCSCSPAG